MAKKSFYPQAPELPPEFSTVTGSYITQTLLLLASLALFFALYFGIMFLCLAFIGFSFFCVRGNATGGLPSGWSACFSVFPLSFCSSTC
ncbi:MAG: hypothetical protein FJ303_22000 [Planctomycetes bacterium]|nr:hypothetical protein [Planctomycetota bacterium]